MSSSARWRLFGSRSSRTETDELQNQVTALQAALQQCRTVVRRTKELTLTLTGAVIVSLVLGFVLGVYNEPIRDSITGLLLRVRGVEDAEAGYLAFQKGRYREALRRLRPGSVARTQEIPTVPIPTRTGSCRAPTWHTRRATRSPTHGTS